MGARNWNSDLHAWATNNFPLIHFSSLENISFFPCFSLKKKKSWREGSALMITCNSCTITVRFWYVKLERIFSVLLGRGNLILLRSVNGLLCALVIYNSENIDVSASFMSIWHKHMHTCMHAYIHAYIYNNNNEKAINLREVRRGQRKGI